MLQLSAANGEEKVLVLRAMEKVHTRTLRQSHLIGHLINNQLQ